MSLLLETLDLLKNRPAWLKLRTISIETNLTTDWLSALQRDKIPDPGVLKIEKLNSYLRNKLNAK